MLYEIIVDGIPWSDADGNESWSHYEAVSIAALLRSQGYGERRVFIVAV